jgi:hypothetical protein
MSRLKFQVREAKTVGRGRRRRGSAPPEPGRTFQVREAATIIVPPPHWEQLTKQQEEPDHAHEPEPDTNRGEAGGI